MVASVMASSVSLKPCFSVEKSGVRGVPSLARAPSSFKVEAKGGKIKTDKPYGQYQSLISSNYPFYLNYIWNFINFNDEFAWFHRNQWWHELEGWSWCLWKEGQGWYAVAFLSLLLIGSFPSCSTAKLLTIFSLWLLLTWCNTNWQYSSRSYICAQKEEEKPMNKFWFL